MYDRVINSLLNNQEALVPFEKVVDQLFKRSYPSFSEEFGCDFFSKASYPKVNVMDYSTNVTISAAVPGLKREDINILYNPSDNTLVISADKQEEKEVPGEFSYLVRELKRSSFKRTFYIKEPVKYDLTNIAANMEDGLLKIYIPKAAHEKKELVNINIK